MTSRSPLPGPADVRVWYARTSDVFTDAARVDRVLGWLQPAELGRYDRYRVDADRRMFLLGRVIARALVGAAAGLPPTAWQWTEGPHGRPEIARPRTSLRFNLAHSADLVACALANGREVGVDVEDLDRRPIDRRLVGRYCSPAEVDDVEAQPADGWHERFLTYWTLKEAYLKARGLGIAVHLADIGFSLDSTGVRIGFAGSLAGTDTRWTFQLVRPTRRHLLAVAASSTDGVAPLVTVEPFPVELAE